MRLFIEPMEPLLFRTGRPFEAGQNNFAESLFPPTPETVQGAVRGAIATYWDPHKNIATAFDDSELTSRIGDRSGYGRFRLTGIALGRYPQAHSNEIERLFPPPAHIMESSKDQHLHRLLPVEKNILSNLPEGIHHYLEPTEKLDDGEDLKPVEGWLTETCLHHVLGPSNLTDIEVIRKKDVYREEPRLGIGIQLGTKATEEGYLYQLLMVRMNHQQEHDYTYGFVVDVDLTPLSPEKQPLTDEQIQRELHLPASGWITLGGEQRTAHFRVLPPSPARIAEPSGERTLLYLATPASFATGWKPSPKFAPLDAPVTAAITRYESIGGWKMNMENARGENKVMRRCVPAGSVYFFHKRVTLHRPLTDHNMEIGYGITLKGEW